ncbi:MAG: transcription elongation factor subunit Spt4 [archaeon]
MVKKACKMCKLVYEGDKCPSCGSTESTAEFKGKVMVFDAENSVIGKNLKVKGRGLYAIKTK